MSDETLQKIYAMQKSAQENDQLLNVMKRLIPNGEEVENRAAQLISEYGYIRAIKEATNGQ
jgi:hypothetical protein